MKKPKDRKLTCPLCKKPLDFKIEGFTCNSAVGGKYVKGCVRLTCSNHSCDYLHSTNFQTKAGSVIARIEALIGMALTKLPNFGPWEVFRAAEKTRQRRKR